MRRIILLVCCTSFLLLTMPILHAEDTDTGSPLQDITIRSGDTLWSVANVYLKDPKRWPEILKYNSLRSSDPNIILPGMVLKVPVLLIKEHLRNAELISLLNDVRYRRKNTTEFLKAELHLKLYNDDALRTFINSHAQIKFYSLEILSVDENSFIIIRPEQKQDEVNLLAGAVRASKTRILAADTVVMPRVTPKSEQSDYKTRLKEDKTTLVEVYEGMVDVTAQGETITLTKGFGTEVKFMKTPSAPKKLPPLPLLTRTIIPGTNITALPNMQPDTLTISLKNPAVIDDTGSKAKVLGQLINKYHVQVSQDRSFSTLVLDEVNPLEDKISINFKQKNIPDGTYFYRIAYMDELGFEGKFTEPNQFSLDRRPPVIEVFQPAEGAFIQTEFVRIDGKTEPGCSIKINNEPIIVDPDGSFQTSIAPKYKEVMITIEAEDAGGNTNILKRTVMYLPGKEMDESFWSKPANILLGILSFSVIAGVVALIF